MVAGAAGAADRAVAVRDGDPADGARPERLRSNLTRETALAGDTSAAGGPAGGSAVVVVAVAVRDGDTADGARPERPRSNLTQGMIVADDAGAVSGTGHEEDHADAVGARHPCEKGKELQQLRGTAERDRWSVPHHKNHNIPFRLHKAIRTCDKSFQLARCTERTVRSLFFFSH